MSTKLCVDECRLVVPTEMISSVPNRYEIETSIEQPPDEPFNDHRQAKRLRLVVTETSTFTQYVFKPSVFKKSITLVNSPATGTAGALVCIPPGFTVC